MTTVGGGLFLFFSSRFFSCWAFVVTGYRFSSLSLKNALGRVDPHFGVKGSVVYKIFLFIVFFGCVF